HQSISGAKRRRLPFPRPLAASCWFSLGARGARPAFNLGGASRRIFVEADVDVRAPRENRGVSRRGWNAGRAPRTPGEDRKQSLISRRHQHIKYPYLTLKSTSRLTFQSLQTSSHCSSIGMRGCVSAMKLIRKERPA
ncbi:MAG: hypothetical protein LBS49_06685, partial [Candidatus Accumulibacter sp.]|nr:hypothetical protein [Accumulibacter sp.]